MSDHWTRALTEHQRLTPEPHGKLFIGHCSCRWQTRPKVSKAIANRAVGLHVAAALRKAERADSAAIEIHYAAQHGGNFLGCIHSTCKAAGSLVEVAS